MRRIILSSIFITIALALLMASYFLVATNSGLQFILKQAQHYAPGKLSYENISGRLISPIKIKHFHYSNQDFSVTITNGEIKWQLRQLVLDRLKIIEFRAQKVDLFLSKKLFERHSSKKTDVFPWQFKFSNIAINTLNLSFENIPQIYIKDLFIQGDTYAEKNEQYINLNAHWNNIETELREQHINTKAGSLELQGPLKNYQLKLHSELIASNLPMAKGIILAQGDLEKIIFKKINIETLNGQLTAQGVVNWKPNLTWQFLIDAQRINPGIQWNKFTGEINFQLYLKGQAIHDLAAMELSLSQLSGTLNHKRISGQFKATITNDSFFFDPKSQLQYGDAFLKIAGGLTKSWNLNWRITIPNFNEIISGTSGKFSSSGVIHGEKDTPFIQTKFDAANIQIFKNTIDSLTGDIDLNLVPRGESKISMTAKNIAVGKIIFENLTIQSSGTSNANITRIALTTKNILLHMQLQGGIKDSFWNGYINQLQIDQQKIPFKLTKKTALTISKKNLQFNNLCLVNGKQLACVTFNWQPNDWRLDLSAQHWSLNYLATSFAPNNNSNLSFSSEINLNAEITKKNDDYAGNFKLLLTPGIINLAVNGRQKLAEIKNGNITGKIVKNYLNVDGLILLTDNQKIMVNLAVPDLKINTSQVSGKISINNANLSLLKGFFPQIDTVHGQIQANINIKGTLENPDVVGEAKLLGGSVSLPIYGLKINNIQLLAQGNNNVFKITGSAHSTPGNLSLNGEIKLNEPGFPMDLKLTGNNFTVFNNPEYMFQASPDLNIQKRAQNITINGSILVPDAFVHPADWSIGSINLADDAVFVDKKQQQQQNNGKYKVSGNITIIAGENVRMQTHGITGKIRGEVTINYNPGDVTTANGGLEIVNGIYNAYGQQLNIKSGHLIYLGGPINNPTLDVVASRTVLVNQLPQMAANMPFLNTIATTQEIEVGVQVKGKLKHHQITLYSYPSSFSQSDIMSLLVTGQTLSNSNPNSAGLLLKAASALNVGGSSFNDITQGIQHTIGLDQIGFQPEQQISATQTSTEDSTALVLGKKLNDRIYVSYSIGIFDPISIFRAKLQLSKNWSIQTSASIEGQGIDIFYNIEK